VGLALRIRRRGLRLATFVRDGQGCRCSACGIPAVHFQLEREGSGDPDRPWCLQLYGQHPNGTWVRFTHDHTLARALGGADDLSNTTTMCAPCNRQKAKGEHRAVLAQRGSLAGSGHGSDLPSAHQQTRLQAQFARLHQHHGLSGEAYRRQCEAAAAAYIRQRVIQGQPVSRSQPRTWRRAAQCLGLSVPGYRYFAYDHHQVMRALQEGDPVSGANPMV
jgi:hypothetical protein